MLGAGLALACGLAWTASRVGTAAEGVRPTIVVTRAAVDRVRAARARESGPAVPSPEVSRLVDEVVEEEILWREGRTLLEGGGDPAVRARLAALRRELAAGRTGEGDADDPAGPDEIAALARTDLVLRRYLVEAARLALARQAPGGPPGDAEVDAWVERSPQRFGRPGRLRFEHVFLSRVRRGDDVRADATALLARLSDATPRSPVDPAAPRDMRRGDASASGRSRGEAGTVAGGDPFPLGTSFTGSPAEVDRAFGEGFARRVAQLPRGRWSGPVDSPLGVHLVRTLESTEPGPARPGSVRGRAALAWRRERSGRLLRERLAELRARYEIRVEEGVDRAEADRAQARARVSAPGRAGS